MLVKKNENLRFFLLAACSHQNHTKNHLRLALAWNRADVALTDVLTAGVTLDDLTISEIFKDALLHVW